jgi:hypothetical protein
MTRLLARVCDTGFSISESSESAPSPLERVYSRLPIMDFSSDLLERAARELRMLAVPPCGWTDLGTPDRIERWYTTQKGDGHDSRTLDDPRCRELYA